MYKIFLTVRNRLEITKKCIESIINHSKHDYQLYIFDNSTDYKVKEHFEFYYTLYKQGYLTQLVCNTNQSTFNAFSKAVACNQFGYHHKMDPDKDKYDFLVFLDNDILVAPNWDQTLAKAWKDVKNYSLKNVKVIGQVPGGIKERKKVDKEIAGCTAFIGKLGGSGFWSVRPDFFDDVGFLSISRLINKVKGHDQNYWRLLDKSSKGNPYIIGLRTKLVIHCGSMAGSVCNRLSKSNSNDITFENQDEKIKNMSFEEFWSKIYDNKKLQKDW